MRQTYTGIVAKRTAGRGSKSEHEAVVLMQFGGDLKLRLQGGNPFSDPRLDAFVGKTVTIKGEILNNNTLMIDDVSDIKVDKNAFNKKPAKPKQPKP